MCVRESWQHEDSEEREKGITKMSLSILLDAFASKGCECQKNRVGENKRLLCNSLISNSKGSPKSPTRCDDGMLRSIGLNFIFW